MKRLMLVLLVAFLSMAFSIAASANNSNEQGYDVEIYANGELNNVIELHPPKPDQLTYNFSIYRLPNGKVARTADGERIYAFQIVPQLKDGFVDIDVLALLENPTTISETHPLDKFRRQVIASYSLPAGESAIVTEMSDVGAEPLKIRVVKR